MIFLWLKALHIIFVVTWFSGLFYLPRLFVYHAMSDDTISIERFKIMERKLYYGIATPGAILSLLFGFGLLHTNLHYYVHAPWFHLKMALVFVVIFYHLYCGYLLRCFRNDNNTFSHVFYRWLNELPVVLLIGIVFLVVLKPFT